MIGAKTYGAPSARCIRWIWRPIRRRGCPPPWRPPGVWGAMLGEPGPRPWTHWNIHGKNNGWCKDTLGLKLETLATNRIQPGRMGQPGQPCHKHLRCGWKFPVLVSHWWSMDSQIILGFADHARDSTGRHDSFGVLLQSPSLRDDIFVDLWWLVMISIPSLKRRLVGCLKHSKQSLTFLSFLGKCHVVVSGCTSSYLVLIVHPSEGPPNEYPLSIR